MLKIKNYNYMTNVKNGVVMNNSNDNTTFNLMNDWNLETSNEVLVRGKIPFKTKLINSISKEIDEIKRRKNLTLLRISKNVKGKRIEVNENRFWKQSIANPNTLLVSIKHKGKIVKFSSDDTPQYFVCENDKNKLVGLLESVKSNVEQLEENHPIFNQ